MPPFQGLPRLGPLPSVQPPETPANPIVPAEPMSLLNLIARAVTDPSIGADKTRAIIDMQREVMFESERRELNRAMSEVQSEIRAIVTSGKNPTFGSAYATLEDLDREARPIYAPRGISIRYGSALTDKTIPAPPAGWLRVVLMLSRDGYSEEHHLDSPIDNVGSKGRANKTPVQAIGSTITYLRRYLLKMVLNLVDKNDPLDDDGEATRGTSHFPHPTVTHPAVTPRPPHPPVDTTDRPRRRISDWLDELAVELQGCEWSEEVDTLLTRPDIRAVEPILVNGAREQYEAMKQDAYDRVHRQERELRGDA